MFVAITLAALVLQTTDNARGSDTTMSHAGGRAAALAAPIVVDTAMPVDTAPPDTVRRRPRPVQYSDWYARRLAIHRIGSYVMLPLFGTEVVLGQQLLNGSAQPHSATGNAHVLVASGIAVLFTVNTVTGLWNLWDSRSDPAGRTRRTIHSLIMLGSDAGFLWTGAVGGQAKRSNDNARYHRNIALGSISVATAGTLMMWLWNN
jgi:hypothetical protein